MIIYDRRTGESKRFGFVYFKHQEDSIKAKEGLAGLILHGNEVRIDFSITKRAYSPTPGRYMGKTNRNYRNDRWGPYSRGPDRGYGGGGGGRYDYRGYDRGGYDRGYGGYGGGGYGGYDRGYDRGGYDRGYERDRFYERDRAYDRRDRSYSRERSPPRRDYDDRR